MNTSLCKLRKKYIITASVIVFAVILLMISTLNILVRASYRNDRKMIENVIEQSAVSHINQSANEHFELSEVEQTENGDYKIPRNIKDISKITVYGNISYKEPALWYSAGGGILFEAEIDDGTIWTYKDYAFSRDATSVSISFDSYDNLKNNRDNISIEESQIVGDYFLVSVIWWKNSSNHDDYDEDVEISVDSIDISYKNKANIEYLDSPVISHSNFSDIFENYIPEILNSTGAFYLVTDSKKRLLSVNDGNLMNPLDNDEAEKYARTVMDSDKTTGKISKDKTSYTYNIYH
ncbi:MAG: hypothetical protein K2G14_05630, partial [Ruminococcus sp.]|nr:hypothetical protein [Ruminococcus sp.]